MMILQPHRYQPTISSQAGCLRSHSQPVIGLLGNTSLLVNESYQSSRICYSTGEWQDNRRPLNGSPPCHEVRDPAGCGHVSGHS